jgi:hypothetical protein
MALRTLFSVIPLENFWWYNSAAATKDHAMKLSRELPVSAQTAYAELQELVQVAEASRSPAFLTGKVAYKTVKGSRYAYWAFKEIDGRKREYYLGPDGPSIAAIERARAEGAPALDAVARQAAAAVAQGCSPMPPKHFRIVKRLADYQFFRAGGLMIGTHAFAVMGNLLGVAWGSGTRTLDLDFAHAGPRGNVDVALPAHLDANAHDALSSLGMGFLPSLGGSKGLASQYVSEKESELRVDFLTTVRRSHDDVQARELGIALTPMKFLDYLIERPGQAVTLDRADAALVNLPDPARYGLHKLIVAHERGARHPKHDKDVLQALALIEWHLERAPHLIADAWEDLVGRGDNWRKRAEASLAAAPTVHRDLVLRFEEAMGAKKKRARRPVS